MGCWDETCAITRMPIRHMDECVLVLTKGTMEPVEFHSIVQLIAIYKGTYNDYGWIREKTKEEENIESAIFFHRLAWDRVFEYQNSKKDFDKERLESLLLNNLQTVNLNFNNNDMKVSELLETLKGKILEFTVEYVYIADYCYSIRRDLLGSKKFKGAQDWNNGDREVVFALERELQDRLDKE